MDNNKFNWQVRTAALSIFFLGLIAGALALNAYQVWFGTASSVTVTKQQRFERIFDQLSLSDSQNTEVQKIMGETRDEIQNLKKENEPKFAEIRGRSEERFHKIMTPEQWNKFLRLRDEFREAEKNNPTNK